MQLLDLQLAQKRIPHSVKASRVLHPLFCYIVQLTFELQIPWEPWFYHGKLASIAGKLRYRYGALHWHVLAVIRWMEEIRLTVDMVNTVSHNFQGFIWVLYIPGGAGFLPKQYLPFISHYLRFVSEWLDKKNSTMNVPTHQLNG